MSEVPQLASRHPAAGSTCHARRQIMRIEMDAEQADCRPFRESGRPRTQIAGSDRQCVPVVMNVQVGMAALVSRLQALL